MQQTEITETSFNDYPAGQKHDWERKGRLTPFIQRVMREHVGNTAADNKPNMTGSDTQLTKHLAK